MRDVLKAARDTLAVMVEDNAGTFYERVNAARAAIAQADAALAAPADERVAFEAWQHRIGLGNNQSARVAWKAWQARSRLSAPADAEDAARYRWLRDPDNATAMYIFNSFGMTDASELDAAIDRARKEQA